MSEPVRLTALAPWSDDIYAIFAQSVAPLGYIKPAIQGISGFVCAHVDPFPPVWRYGGDTREAAAVALARACGIPNPLPPKVWP